jgi:hypothetical protein
MEMSSEDKDDLSTAVYKALRTDLETLGETKSCSKTEWHLSVAELLQRVGITDTSGNSISTI